MLFSYPKVYHPQKKISHIIMTYRELLMFGLDGIYVYNTVQRSSVKLRSGKFTSAGRDRDKHNYITIDTKGRMYTSQSGYQWLYCKSTTLHNVHHKLKCSDTIMYIGPFYSERLHNTNDDRYSSWSTSFKHDVSVLDVEYNGSMWLAAGDDIYTSPDGKAWKQRFIADMGGGKPRHITTVLWDTKQWILSGRGTGIFIVNESVTTSLRTMPPQGPGVCPEKLFFDYFAPIRYMAGQTSASETVALSTPLVRSHDAMQWTACELGINGVSKVCDITYKNKIYYVVAQTTDLKYHLFTSLYGIHWTHISNDIPAVHYIL